MHGRFKIEVSGYGGRRGGKRVGIATVAPRSDGNSEFSEGPASRCVGWDRQAPAATLCHLTTSSLTPTGQLPSAGMRRTSDLSVRGAAEDDEWRARAGAVGRDGYRAGDNNPYR
jgi:hypothetical protein